MQKDAASGFLNLLTWYASCSLILCFSSNVKKRGYFSCLFKLKPWSGTRFSRSGIGWVECRNGSSESSGIVSDGGLAISSVSHLLHRGRWWDCNFFLDIMMSMFFHSYSDAAQHSWGNTPGAEGSFVEESELTANWLNNDHSKCLQLRWSTAPRGKCGVINLPRLASLIFQVNKPILRTSMSASSQREFACKIPRLTKNLLIKSSQCYWKPEKYKYLKYPTQNPWQRITKQVIPTALSNHTRLPSTLSLSICHANHRSHHICIIRLNAS